MLLVSLVCFLIVVSRMLGASEAHQTSAVEVGAVKGAIHGLSTHFLSATYSGSNGSEDAGVQVHWNPEFRGDVLKQFEERYPEPVSASPDGSKVLLKRLNRHGDPFGLSIFDSRERRVIASTEYDDAPMRLAWRPDNNSLSFFLQNRKKDGRILHLWDLTRSTDVALSTPPARAEDNMKWSPDSRFFAYQEKDAGLVILDSAGSAAPAIIQNVSYMFTWFPDSKRLAFVPVGSLNTIRIIDVTGKVLDVISLPSGNQILDLRFSQPRNEFVIVNRTPTEPFLVETISIRSKAVNKVFRSNNEIDYPWVLPDGAGCLVELVARGQRDVFVVSLGGKTARKLNLPSGDNQVLSVAPDSRSATVMHRGEGPPSVLQIGLESGRRDVIYKPAQGSGSKSELKWITSEDGYQIPLYIWRSEQPSKVHKAIIRLHGFNVKEDGLWQDEIKLATEQGFDYVVCNFRGSLGFGYDLERQGTIDNQIKDVRAAIRYTQGVLRIPFKNITLLGYSAGADLALRSAAESERSVGTLALVGASAQQIRTARWSKSSHPHILLFHGRYEPVSLNQIRDKARLIAELTESSNSVEVYEIDDNHDFNYPKSRAEIYSAIFERSGSDSK